MSPVGPPVAPSGGEVADRDRFATLTAGNLAAVQASAEKWRAGLAALVTLAVGGVFAKGPGAFNDIGGRAQRWAVVGFGFLGLGLALFGFWSALRASAGDLAVQRQDEIVSAHGSVAAFEVAQAAEAAGNLETAKYSLALALACFVVGSFIWVVAPKPSPDPPVVKVTPVEGQPYCGTLKSADQQTLRVQVAGEKEPRAAPFTSIANIAVAAKCG
jgi:hypothetical protein